MDEEKELLSKMYECQEMMAKLLDKGDKDIHYLLMEVLVKRLEDYLSNQQDLL